MANEEQVLILKQGVKTWNDWRSKNEKIAVDLSNADLSNADLSNVDFRYANLAGVILFEADLSGANLSGADLNGASFSKANLSGANLSRIQALVTNFNGATFTGACLEDWHINDQTDLDRVICDYVFLKKEYIEEKPKFSERRPHNPNEKFALGEFTKLFQYFRNTIDLVFRDGINWKAFSYAFEVTKNEHEGAELVVQSIENKNDGVIVIKLGVSPKVDKTTIHGAFMQGYKLASSLLEAQYRAELNDKSVEIVAKDAQIISYNRVIQKQDEQINKLFSLVQEVTEVQKLMAEAPKYDMRGTTIGNFVDTAQPGSRQQVIQYNYDQEQKQSLAEAALEIQHLLKQLEATNPQATEAEKKVFITKETTLNFRQRAVNALRCGGKAAIEEFLDNHYVNVVLAIIEGWNESK
jgi:uncharacterized protein YjbI with pentapeptide repeats